MNAEEIWFDAEYNRLANERNFFRFECGRLFGKELASILLVVPPLSSDGCTWRELVPAYLPADQKRLFDFATENLKFNTGLWYTRVAISKFWNTTGRYLEEKSLTEKLIRDRVRANKRDIVLLTYFEPAASLAMPWDDSVGKQHLVNLAAWAQTL